MRTSRAQAQCDLVMCHQGWVSLAFLFPRLILGHTLFVNLLLAPPRLCFRILAILLGLKIFLPPNVQQNPRPDATRYTLVSSAFQAAAGAGWEEGRCWRPGLTNATGSSWPLSYMCLKFAADSHKLPQRCHPHFPPLGEVEFHHRIARGFCFNNHSYTVVRIHLLPPWVGPNA